MSALPEICHKSQLKARWCSPFTGNNVVWGAKQTERQHSDWWSVYNAAIKGRRRKVLGLQNVLYWQQEHSKIDILWRNQERLQPPVSLLSFPLPAVIQPIATTTHPFSQKPRAVLPKTDWEYKKRWGEATPTLQLFQNLNRITGARSFLSSGCKHDMETNSLRWCGVIPIFTMINEIAEH